MKTKLRLGLLGTGVAAHRLYLPAFQELTNKIELYACSNRTRKKATAYARVAGIPRVVDTAEELFELPELDAVLISLPIEAQPPLILKALERGKAVLSEKPIAPTVAGAKKLIRSAKKFKRPWMVAENFAFMAHVQRLKDAIDAGKLGAVRLVEARQMTWMDRKNPYFGTAWRHAPEFLGGFVVDGGVHVADLVRQCFGKPVRIQSFSAHLADTLPPPDTAVAALQFESGALGTWTSCFCARYDGPMLRVYGSKADAEVSWSTLVVRSASGKETRYESPVNSFTAQFDHFADVVLKRVKPRITPEQALEDLEIVEAIARGR